MITEVQKLMRLGFTDRGIVEITGLSERKVRNTIRGIKKITNTYNDDHLVEKYEANEDFFYNISPKNILDLFAGQRRYWFTKFSDKVEVLDNDIEFPAVCKNDAWNLMEYLEQSDEKFDLIDVDPFNSPAGLIRKSIKMVKKGLIITFGDVKQVHRFSNDKTQNYFRDTYGISKNPKDIKIEDIRNRIIEIGKEEGKILNLFAEFSWKTIMRFYFKIEA